MIRLPIRCTPKTLCKTPAQREKKDIWSNWRPQWIAVPSRRCYGGSRARASARASGRPRSRQLLLLFNTQHPRAQPRAMLLSANERLSLLWSAMATQLHCARQPPQSRTRSAAQRIPPPPRAIVFVGAWPPFQTNGRVLLYLAEECHSKIPGQRCHGQRKCHGSSSVS